MPKPVYARPIAVGAYIFAGGFTLGVRKAGFDVLCHLEETDYGVATFEQNNPSIPVHVGKDNWPLCKLVKKVDFIYGNPPCAAWSVAGYSNKRGTDKWLTDPRVECTRRHFSLLEKLRPKFWAWESVTQAFGKGRSFVDELTVKAMKIGYSISFLLHDAQYLGLSQTRKRFFMVCHNRQFTPITPDFTRTILPTEVLSNFGGGKQEYNRYSRGYLEYLLPHVLPGERLTKTFDRYHCGKELVYTKAGKIKGRPPFGIVRLPQTKPSGAIVGYEMVHPTEDRFISIEEMMVLQGYPKNYRLYQAKLPEKARELARGVCPPVGYWLARSVSKAIKADRKIKRPTVILYDFRKPNTPSEDLTGQYNG